jgi:hypothetical protein
MLRRLGLLVLALAVLAAAGAFNYRRNLALESQAPRPLRGYDEAELAALAKAYEGELKTLEARYRAKRDARAPGGQEGELLDEKVRAFERASARTQAVRGAGAELSMKEAALADVRAEQARRREDPGQVHLRRLLSF